MKGTTLAMMVLVAGAAAGRAVLAGAQEPPPPPVRPVPPTPPAPRPVQPAMAWPSIDLYAPYARIDAEQAREAARAAMASSLDAARMASDWARDNARMDAEWAMDRARAMTPLAAMAPMAPMAPIGPMAYVGPRDWVGDGFEARMPPQAWAQGDPADSLYRVARDALNRGDYGNAARLFADISQKFPKSDYANDAPYWEAFARYRVGTTDELHTAEKVLEPLVAKGATVNVSYDMKRTSFTGRRGASEGEVAALYQRINGALAQRGDKDAADRVAKAVTQAGKSPCDEEDIRMKGEALNALSQIDPAAAFQALRRVLERKDECSAPLRRSAVFMLGRRADTAATPVLIAVAKSDPNVNVRTQAIDFLPRLPGEAGLSVLDDMLKNDQDERIQRAAVRALTQSDNARARSSMRALIDRKDAPLNLRIEAISSLNNDRATTDDAAYLRGLYARADNDRLKETIVCAVSRMGGAENDQWVLTIARNTSESSQARAAALSCFSRSQTVSVADLGKLYDSADSYNMRSQIVSILSMRKEPEATDKLIDIIKSGTDYRIRTQAISAITRKNDPRATKALMDIIDKNPSDTEKKP